MNSPVIPKQLSEHFSSAEATFSSTATRLEIDNSIPSEEVLENLLFSARKMERVRTLFGTAIYIDSWYRCLLLNRALKSQDTSAHLKGLAVDFVVPAFGNPLAVVRRILAYKELIGFDKIILEHTWVHISFSRTNPRGLVYSLLRDGTYKEGLTDKDGNPYSI